LTELLRHASLVSIPNGGFMARIDFSLDDDVAVITLNDGENCFNPLFMQAFMDTLDRLEEETDVSTMVVKSSHEKIFSNGLDLEWLLPQIENRKSQVVIDFFYRLNALFKRILTYPMITIAAITGHAFAAGAILSCAFDFRYMRSDRGYFCLPEIDLGIPFLPGMIAILKKAIPPLAYHELVYTGKRFTAEECEEHRIITRACHLDHLMAETLAFAKAQTKKRGIIREIKAREFRHIIDILEHEDPSHIESGRYSY
jgi:enoyl-CoA hydratase/carnithine racemase